MAGCAAHARLESCLLLDEALRPVIQSLLLVGIQIELRGDYSVPPSGIVYVLPLLLELFFELAAVD